MLEEELNLELDRLRKGNLYRELYRLETAPGPTAVIDGRKVIIFSSNNYLGLSTHPEVIEAAKRALQKFGTGAGASRLLAGNLKLHEELEEEIARFKKTPCAIVFSSGYLANAGVISSILGPDDLAVSDKLNHASLMDGCRTSKAKLLVYGHGNPERLKEILKRYRSKLTGSQRCMLITDGVFSMDGDIAPLPEILEIASRHGSSVLIDDAHATGVLGKTGRGTLEHFGLVLHDGCYNYPGNGSVTVIQMGTLSKALGSLGGFVAGSKTLIDYLRNKARSFIYTTALPPAVCASALAALNVLQKEPDLLNKLRKNADYLRKGLIESGYKIPDGETPIIPIIMGESMLALSFSKELFKAGVFAPAIRPPTVPKGEARLRLSVTAAHTKEHMDFTLEKFKKMRGFSHASI